MKYNISEECPECGATESYDTNYPLKKGDNGGFCRYCRTLMVINKVVKNNVR